MEDVENNCLKCVIKKPILLRVGSPSVDFKSGCSVIDVSFPNIEPVEIGSLSFLNNYTASISMKFKTSDDSWKVCLKNFILMPFVHCEERSQSTFKIKTCQMVNPIKDAILLRIILRQPSPHWLNFSIDQLCFYPPTMISSHLSNVLLSGIEHEDDQTEKNSQVVDIANKLQQMWALTETVTVEDGELEEPPHFDIDGCYDLNLLSYT